jgi:DNA-binding MarR family transcriptional regulator
MALGIVGAEIETATGLSGADFSILTRLEDMGDGAILQHELAKALGWHKSRLSHQLTRMEGRALLRRDVPGSGQGVLVAILPAGREVIMAARPVHAAAVRKHILGYLSPTEARVLVGVVARMDI